MFSIIQKKNDNICGIWCITTRLHLVKLNARQTKNFGKFFDAKKTTGINRDGGLMLKDTAELENFYHWTKIVFELVENGKCPPVFLTLGYSKEVAKDKDEGKK